MAEDDVPEKSEQATPEGAQKPLIEYPTDYTFKVMGKQENGFKEHVRHLFKRAMGTELPVEAFVDQPSKQGTYLSVSVTVYLLSEEQRRTIYELLHKDRLVRYYL